MEQRRKQTDHKTLMKLSVCVPQDVWYVYTADPGHAH